MPRPRLVERLNAGLLGHSDRFARTLTLVSAPAGFGKTTLVVEWLNNVEQAFTWLSLDESDNDPVRFFTYLVAALQRIDPNLGQIAQAMLQAPQPPAPESLLTALINDIAATPHLFVLVLEDYHLINALSVHQHITFLLNHQLPQMHVAIVTRQDPPLPLPRLRARGQMVDIRQADLRFTVEETDDFLRRVMQLDLSPADVAALHQRTEGWIAGLQMAAVSMQGRDDTAGFVQAFTGGHRYIFDYLGQEVLRQQPEDVRRFLLHTSILDRLTGSLCDAVVGIDESAGLQPDEPPIRSFADPAAESTVSEVELLGTGSQAMLEHLERNNLFIVPLDDERRWYRYHHLFADLLRQRLHWERRDLVPELHRRASEWYEENGLIPEAVNQALASGDFERAACLIEWTAWAMLTRGEMMTLLGWLDVLPDDLVRSRPQLGILQAWALALTGQLDGAESHLPDVDVQRVPGDLAAVRAYVASHRGDMRRVIEFCHQAFERLPEEKWFSRGIAAVILGTAPLKSGDPVAASRALAEAVRLSQTDGRTYLTLLATTMLGEAQEMEGLLRQAVKTYRQALQLASEQGRQPAPSAGMAYVGIAGPLYEWNDLDGAMCHAMKGVELSEQGGSVDTIEDGYINLAQVHQARGDVNKAFEMIREVERLAQTYNHGYWTAVADEIRTRLWVRRGNIAAASRWVQERRLSAGDGPEYTREFEHIAAVRVLIARALSQASRREGEIGEALRFLARLLEAAEAARRMGSVIKILALQALAFQAQGDVGQALSAVEHGLSLAEPEGYVRTFVDEGEPMARLLRCALSQGIAPNYVARLLAAFGEEVELTFLAMESLIEPLSERELEVLRLVVAGLSNPEIAQELVIAVSTVKSHVNHIYGKLGVESRTQAVARAQELGLL